MTDRPILFSAPMVRALIAGTKTQTRRSLNPQPYPLEGRPGFWNASGAVGGRICVSDRALLDLHRKPATGDRLYVREHWRTLHKLDVLSPRHLAEDRSIITYEADSEHRNPLWAFGRFRQAMHMPRWASRITLLVDDVKVERLQNISYADAIAEGVEAHDGMDANCMGYRDYSDPDRQHWVNSYVSYATLWDSINEKRGVPWRADPFVVAYTFRVVLENIDHIGRAAA